MEQLDPIYNVVYKQVKLPVRHTGIIVISTLVFGGMICGLSNGGMICGLFTRDFNK